jgi:hypothetical protein
MVSFAVLGLPPPPEAAFNEASMLAGAKTAFLTADASSLQIGQLAVNGFLLIIGDASNTWAGGFAAVLPWRSSE